MATTNTLKMIIATAGGDTRTISVPDPLGNLTREDFATLEAAAAGVIVSDNGSFEPYNMIQTAYYSSTTITELDVAPQMASPSSSPKPTATTHSTVNKTIRR